MSDRWFEAFSQDPKMAITELFTGRAGVGASMRLDVPELLRLWFPPSLTEERARLDEALLGWLDEMRESYTPQVEQLGFSVYGKRVGDALIALQLLDLPRARGEIRNNMDAWLRWLSPLRLAPERDPALECLRLLTQGQPDSRHTATWLRLAMDRRAEYLTVALAGLQLLPNGGDASKNQVLMLQALLCNATTRFHDTNGARGHFNRHFGALRGLYPRGPQHWHSILEEALTRFEHRVPTGLARDLAHELRKRQPVTRRKPHRKSPAPKQEWTALLSDIHNQSKKPEELAQRLFKVLERNNDYASETGDSYPFSRTLCHLGREMLERHALGMSEMNQLGLMVERALTWEPANPYCWMLWAQWHKVQDQRDAQEAILREMLRMFPRDVPSQVELARLLIWRDEENWLEAEHHLRRAMDQDPNDGYAYVVMARLLCLRGQRDDAEKTLKEFLVVNAGNHEARDLLDKLRAGYTISYSGPSDYHPRSLAEESVPVEGVRAAVAGGLPEILRRGRLAGEFSRARIANGYAVQTTRIIRQESRQGDSLAGFYSQWLQLEDTPECPPHAWAWVACRHWQNAAAPEVWRDLAQRFPEAAPETEFLRSLTCPDSVDNEGWWRRHLAKEGGHIRPVDSLMRQMCDSWAPDSASQQERDEAACTVMACAAANAPEFAARLD